MEIFNIQNLSFRYLTSDSKALCNVDVTVSSGEFIVLCGKSGSGKTTLLRHMKSVLSPHGEKSGRVLFCGKPVEECSPAEQAKRIGYVMQDPDKQLVTDKVWHELAFGLESIGEAPDTMRLRVAEMASYFGIQDWFDRDVSVLSGGQKQLLNLASVMAMHPDVLILDEPTSQMDPIAAADFLGTIRRLNRELGTSVIISEHRLEDIFYAADRAIVMDSGRIIADAAPVVVGEQLFTIGDDMFSAMPVPVRVFYGSGHGGGSPLTVREGRAWLDRVCPEGFSAVKEAQPCFGGTALSMKDVWFRYGRQDKDVLKGADLHVPKGCIFAIAGGNGTGKSTLLKAICGIVKPYRGRIKTDCRIAMLPQEPESLFSKGSVREELLEMSAQIDEVADLCRLGAVLDSHPYDLSGGEQQRAALAKVLLAKPSLLLLDEPTKGLDCFFKKSLIRLLKGLCEKGVTVIMVSHDVEFCAECADLVGLFFDGQLLTSNTARKFFSCNSFYTTAANRMARHLLPDAITAQDIITAIAEGGK